MSDFLSHFNFQAVPFTREISVRHCFKLPYFDEALSALQTTIEQRMSAALIAPAGTGKTCLLRDLICRLPEARYRTHYVKVADLSKREMCREIAEAIGCAPAGCYPTLVRRLQDHFLQNSDTDGLRPVLIIDESHGLRPEVLSMLRVLTNFEMDSRLVVSIIICGQPSLGRLLKKSDMDDVAKRLSHFATLRPLTRDESHRYIDHRCNIVGAPANPFDHDSREALFEIARGNLRATDHLALKSLEVAHRNNKCAVVDSNHVIEARRSLWP